MNAWRRQPVRSNGCTSQLVCACQCFISVLVCAPLFLRCLILRFQPAPARAAPSARRGAGDGVGARGRAGPDGDANREVHGGRRRACLVERRETRETRADRETRVPR